MYLFRCVVMYLCKYVTTHLCFYIISTIGKSIGDNHVWMEKIIKNILDFICILSNKSLPL